MRNMFIVASAAIVAAALVTPALLPRYLASEGYVFRIDPITGSSCIARFGGYEPVQALQEFEGQICDATRRAAVAALEAELARRGKVQKE